MSPTWVMLKGHDKEGRPQWLKRKTGSIWVGAPEMIHVDKEWLMDVDLLVTLPCYLGVLMTEDARG